MRPTGVEGVTLRQLQYFVAVVEHGSFTAASGELHVAQPSLSQQVRSLEQVVGGPLLERGPRGVHPTPAGELLLPKAYAALQATGDGLALAHREIVHPGSVCLTVAPGAPAAVLAAAIARWRETRPGAEVNWVEFPEPVRILEKVAEGPSVVGVCATEPDWTGETVQLTHEPLVLARPARVSSTAQLLLVRNGHEHLASAAAGHPIDVAGSEEAVALVRAGTAIAVLPRSLARTDGVRVEELPGAPTVTFRAFAAPNPTLAATDMLRHIANAASARERPTIIAVA